MCINTHCTPIKFSKYYPATNGKAGGQTTKKVKEPLYKTYEKGDDISYRLFPMTLVIVFFAYKIMHNNF